MDTQSTETLIVSSSNTRDALPTSSSSSSLLSLVSYGSSNSSSSLNKVVISHGIDSRKLELKEFLNANTTLGDEPYDKLDNHHGSRPIELNLQQKVDQICQTTKLHPFRPDNDDVRNYPHHDHTHVNYDGSLGGSTRSAHTSSCSSLCSFSSGNYETECPPFHPGHYSEMEQQRPSDLPILTIAPLQRQQPQHHHHHSSSSRLPKMSRPVRVTLSSSNKNYQAARYKTELCLHFREHNSCPHADMCLFAHGLSELRPYRGRHPKHKTQPCRSFHQTGFCNYGYRCSYIHLESPETIKYLRGLNVSKAQEDGCTNQLVKPAKCEIGLNTRDRVQFKHK